MACNWFREENGEVIHMKANDDPKSSEILKGAGWSKDQPEGWIEPEKIEENLDNALVAITKLKKEVESLKADIAELTKPAANEGTPQGTISLQKDDKKGK